MMNFLAAQAGGISFTVIFSILSLAVFAVAIWLLCVGLRGGKLNLKIKTKYVFLIVLAVGTVIRIVTAFSMKGIVGYVAAATSERAGYNGLFNMTQYLVTNGFDGFLKSYSDVFYYPLTAYIFALFGAVLSLFTQLSISGTATLVFLKLPFIIAEVLLAVAVYKIAAKYAGETAGLALGGIVAVCPVFMLGSACASTYVFFALALALTAYFMLERKYVKLLVSYSVCLLLCFQAIFLLPIVATFLIYAYVKKVIAYKKASLRGGLWSSEYGIVVKLPIALVLCIAASYLVTLPFTVGYVGASPFAMLNLYFIKPFNNFSFYTYNGLSLYTIFGRNGVKLSLSFPTYVFSILFFVAIIAITLIVYLSKKNRANLLMLVSYLLLTVNTYFVESSEFTLLPFLAVSLIVTAVIKDKRIVKIFMLVAFMTFLNACGVMLKANYFVANATYSSELLSDAWQILSIVASVVTVLAHVYYTIVLLDIVMNENLKPFNARDDKFGSALKDFIKIKEEENAG